MEPEALLRPNRVDEFSYGGVIFIVDSGRLPPLDVPEDFHRFKGFPGPSQICRWTSLNPKRAGCANCASSPPCIDGPRRTGLPHDIFIRRATPGVIEFEPGLIRIGALGPVLVLSPGQSLESQVDRLLREGFDTSFHLVSLESAADDPSLPDGLLGAIIAIPVSQTPIP